jgi:uncharacterized membrane protein
MSTAEILYCGDSALSGAAGYLAGLMTSFGLAYDYVPSSQPLSERQATGRKLYILSDYAGKMIPPAVQKCVVTAVEQGAGVIMIGGWETFCGLGGDWADTAIGAILPVEIQRTDDRVNCDQPALLVGTGMTHPITDGLPWSGRPPTIGGFNRCQAKTQAQTLLELQRFSVSEQDGKFVFNAGERVPMLAVGSHGKGRTVAFMTDLAPHWVGGFVDWGDTRVVAKATGSWEIEVGNWYARFVEQMLGWAGSTLKTTT